MLDKIKNRQNFEIKSNMLEEGIVNYIPEELILTVKAGTKIADINKTLAKNNQALPFITNNKTIGGAYATGISLNQYPIRDFVLGVKLIDGKARKMSFGGEMIKNVAGYDVARMLIGSRGNLAVISEISFKVMPLNYVEKSIKNATKLNKKTAIIIKLEKRLKAVFDPYNIFL